MVYTKPIINFSLSVLSVWIIVDNGRAADEDFSKAVKKCKFINSKNYRVDPYIQSAIALQELGFDEACKRLRSCLEDKKSLAPVPELCRLLFKARKDSKFRRHGIGGVGFLGGTKYEDWLLDPFEIVDGVPFVVTDGTYALGGVPESDRSYLEHCIKDCDWNDFKYSIKSNKEKSAALDLLIKSDKWKKQLNRQELVKLQLQNK